MPCHSWFRLLNARHVHDSRMRSLWKKFSHKQLNLPGVDAAVAEPPSSESAGSNGTKGDADAPRAKSKFQRAADPQSGKPLIIPIALLEEGRANPRTEFPEAELEELAASIRQQGILEPIVVYPANSGGRHCIHFGAKRLRAAQRAGLQEVPVVVRDAPTDHYAQFAENQKRHGLTALDIARFIRARADEGESNTTVARRTGMNLTTVAHHLALLDLPPELDEALKSGRCTSPRTLHELGKLRDERPEQARALIDGKAEITRAKVSSMRSRRTDAAACPANLSPSARLLAQAHAACDRLQRAMDGIEASRHALAPTELDALRQRIAGLAGRWLLGV